LNQDNKFLSYLSSNFFTVNFLAAWFLVAAWWLGSQYLGADVKDGLLYSGEAIRQLHPQNFVKDPFFMDSTQGNYTFFGKLYGQLISWLGIYPAGLIISSLGRILWCIGAITLVRELRTPSGSYLAPLILIFTLPATYDGLQMFGYGEVVVTSRCWSEALLLLALAAQLRDSKWISLALAFGAASLHPLMALTGWILLVGLQKPRVRNILVVLGVMAFCALVLAQISPFANILKTYDLLWWQQVSEVNYYVLASAWPAQAYSKMLGWLILLSFVAYAHPEKRFARLARILAWVYLFCIVVWVIGCQTQNVLLMQLQTWRILWLVQLLAPALWISSLPPLRDWDWHTWGHATLIITAILSSSWGISLAILPGVLLLLSRGHYTPTPFLKKVFLLVPCVLFLMILPARNESFFIRVYENEFWSLPHPFLLSLSAEPVVLLVLCTGSASAIIFRTEKSRLISVMVCALVLSALCAWYLLFQFSRATTPRADVSQIQKIIPPGAVVYWREDAKRVWLNLQRAHYAGPLQGAGSIFSQQAAFEFYRRIDLLKRVDLQITGFEGISPEIDKMNHPLGLADLCADPVLGFVILNGRDDVADYHVPYAGVREQEVSIVDCKKYRK
jgi:hypothetical protein